MEISKLIAKHSIMGRTTVWLFICVFCLWILSGLFDNSDHLMEQADFELYPSTGIESPVKLDHGVWMFAGSNWLFERLSQPIDFGTDNGRLEYSIPNCVCREEIRLVEVLNQLATKKAPIDETLTKWSIQFEQVTCHFLIGIQGDKRWVISAQINYREHEITRGFQVIRTNEIVSRRKSSIPWPSFGFTFDNQAQSAGYCHCGIVWQWSIVKARCAET